LLLGRRGLKIRLLEAREDFREQERKTTQDVSLGNLADAIKRSINLALSHRGICALKSVGVFPQVEPLLVPLKGRLLHNDLTGQEITFQPYGQEGQAIYSVSRGALNGILLSELEKLPNVEIIFNCKVTQLQEDGTIRLNGIPLKSSLVIGADGAFSKVREVLCRYAKADFSIQYLTTGYKELVIPANSKGEYAMRDVNGLHIWPRQDFTLLAFANPDKTFTCTYFAPFKGTGGLDNLITKEQVLTHFEKYFPDFVPLVPNLVQQWLNNPSSPLVTIRLAPYHYRDKIVVIGDAAHAVVPFYGQGMNAAFEDCLTFDELWEKYRGDRTRVLEDFTKLRQPAGHALAQLSSDHYAELESKTASRLFLLRRKVERFLHWLAPSVWVPEYTLVTFTRTPYHEALQRARKQDKILDIAVGVLGFATIAGLVGSAFYHRDSLQSFFRSRM